MTRPYDKNMPSSTDHPATQPLLMLTTWPEREAAERAAEGWVNKRLAACVNILPRMQSIYCWEGELQRGEEHQILIKTDSRRADALQQAIVEAHPYECPEIIRLEISGGHEPYLNWITTGTPA